MIYRTNKENYLTIKEYAEKQGVTMKTVHDWIKKDLLTYELTPSGRKRITGVKEIKR